MASLLLHTTGIFTLIAFVILIPLTYAARWFSKRTHTNPAEEWPLVAKPLLTAREREWHGALMRAYPGHYVFTQVALSQLLDVKPGIAERTALGNRFRQLVADFVVCGHNYQVIVVVEVDDSSHESKVRRDADERKTKALQSAGIPLVRIPPRARPSASLLRRLPGLVHTGISAATRRA